MASPDRNSILNAVEPATEPLQRNSRRLRISLAVTAVVLLLAGVLLLAFRAATFWPSFYRIALTNSVATNTERGKLFERELVHLSNQLRLESNWSSRWTQPQLNGWLAADLPEKFPELLPKHIIDPRVQITNEEVRIVFQFRNWTGDYVVQIAGEVFATEATNQIAFRLREQRCGWIPLPLSGWARELERVLQQSDLRLEWSEWQGDPLALVTIPANVLGEDRQFELKTIQLADGELLLAGKASSGEAQSMTGELPPPASVPASADVGESGDQQKIIQR